ncbi:fluoride efflux transporter CrcB [soil metagenome]|jgi:CrcB protein
MRDAAVMASPVRSRGRVAAAVGLGGAMGAGLRHAVAVRFPASPGLLPWPTFVENVSGALLLGLALTLLLRRRPGSRGLRAFVGTGVLGAYTTFSALSVELVALVGAGRPEAAAGYAAFTLTCGLAAAFTGVAIGRTVPVRRP